MNQTSKTILSFLLLLTVFITNASEELLRQLAREVDPNQAQKRARMFLKGDKEKCIELFQQALKEGKAVAQIYLSNTHTTMGWAQDHKKDFSEGIEKEQLKSYNFAPLAMELLENMHKKADPRLHKDWKKMKKAAHRTVDQAEKTGNLYAKLLQILEKKSKCPPLWHFGLACKLKPLIEKAQFPELLFCFGASLFKSAHYNSQFELEGLKYKEKSGLLDLKFFEDKKKHIFYDFNDYCTSYTRYKNFHDKYGICFVGDNTILVPSREDWEKFKKEKLETVQPSPDSLFDLFEKHNMDQIYNLVKKYELEFLSSHSSLNIHYRKSGKQKRLGEIRLIDIESKNTSVNIQLPPQQQEELSPVISFLRDALSRCGDVSAVIKIMQNLEYDPALNPDRV